MSKHTDRGSVLSFGLPPKNSDDLFKGAGGLERETSLKHLSQQLNNCNLKNGERKKENEKCVS